MVDFGGWELPQQYSSIREEHFAVRQSAGLFDLSHMGRLEISGPQAEACLQRLLTNDLDACPPGRAQYSLLCRDDGGILDDLVVYRRSVDEFLLVVNAANSAKDREWIAEHISDGVVLRDRTDDLALVALQGPEAAALLPVSGLELDQMPYFGFAVGSLAGVDVLVARTGYTGEDGFELFVPAEASEKVWDRLLAAGSADGHPRPCGLGARDVCRLEAALRLYGSDMDESTNPFDAGLSWVVKLDKTDFIGRAALRAIRDRGPTREIVGLRVLGRGIPRHSSPILLEGEVAGVVTSGTHSFWLDCAIALASLPKGAAARTDRIEADVRGQLLPTEQVRLPFWKGSVRSGRRPAATA